MELGTQTVTNKNRQMQCMFCIVKHGKEKREGNKREKGEGNREPNNTNSKEVSVPPTNKMMKNDRDTQQSLSRVKRHDANIEPLG